MEPEKCARSHTARPFTTEELWENYMVDQTVIYMATPPLRMRDSIDVGSVRVQYRLFDIRELKAEDLARSPNPADRARELVAAVAGLDPARCGNAR